MTTAGPAPPYALAVGAAVVVAATTTTLVVTSGLAGTGTGALPTAVVLGLGPGAAVHLAVLAPARIRARRALTADGDAARRDRIRRAVVTDTTSGLPEEEYRLAPERAREHLRHERLGLQADAPLLITLIAYFVTFPFRQPVEWLLVLSALLGAVGMLGTAAQRAGDLRRIRRYLARVEARGD